MSAQHRIMHDVESLELRLAYEVQGYWRLSYRQTIPGFEHRDAWADVEHLTVEELIDVLYALVETHLEDVASALAF